LNDDNFEVALSIAILKKQRGDAAGAKRLVNDAFRFLKSKPKTSPKAVDFDAIYRAKLHILTGQYDLALEELTESVHGNFAAFPYGWTLAQDPVWDPVRADPRFQTIERKYRDDVAQQHALLMEMRRKGEVPQRNAT
jgi:hypothetical protein